MLSWLVILPVIVPIFFGLAALAARRQTQTAMVVERVGLSLAAATVVTLGYEVLTSGPTFVAAGGWPESFAITLIADRAALLMIAVATVSAIVTSFYGRRRRAASCGLVLLLVGGVNGAFLAGDLFNLYVWFELTILASVGLLITEADTRGSRSFSRYVVANLLASAFLLAGVGLVYGTCGTVQIADIGPKFATLDASLQFAITSFFVVGFVLKAGGFPLFAWLPSAYATLPPALVALFSAVLTKLSVYALFRVLSGAFADVAIAFKPVLVAIACATMVFGVLAALAQTDIRRLLSFHIVSQVGYLLLAIALSTPEAATAFFVFFVHIAIAKAALFLVAGMIADEGGTYDLQKLGGLSQRRPLLTLLFAVSALALIGIPPLSGFWAKLLVVKAALADSAWLASGIALAVSSLTLLSMVKIWIYAFWRPHPEPASLVDHSPSRLPAAATATLCLATVAIGVAPAGLYNLASAAAADMWSLL